MFVSYWREPSHKLLVLFVEDRCLYILPLFSVKHIYLSLDSESEWVISLLYEQTIPNVHCRIRQNVLGLILNGNTSFMKNLLRFSDHNAWIYKEKYPKWIDGIISRDTELKKYIYFCNASTRIKYGGDEKIVIPGCHSFPNCFWICRKITVRLLWQ